MRKDSKHFGLPNKPVNVFFASGLPAPSSGLLIPSTVYNGYYAFTDLFGGVNYTQRAGNSAIKKNNSTKAVISDTICCKHDTDSGLQTVDFGGLQVVPGVARCSLGGYMAFTCPNGHLIRKLIGCNHEYCLQCGAKWGKLHQQRYFRGVNKVQFISKQVGTLGYLVCELPAEFQGVVTSKQLSGLQSYMSKHLRRIGYKYGVSSWHWCGDDGKRFIPHLNILFSAGFLSEQLVNDLRQAWTAAVNRSMPASIRKQYCNRLINAGKRPLCTVHYSYAKGKQVNHRWRYVIRPTWRVYSEQINDIVFNFRNIRWWGDYKHKEIENAVELVDGCRCPVCTAPMKPAKMFSYVRDINREDYIHAGGGIFVWKYKIPPDG